MRVKYKVAASYGGISDVIIIYFKKDKSLGMFVGKIDNVFDYLQSKEKVKYLELDKKDANYGKIIGK